MNGSSSMFPIITCTVEPVLKDHMPLATKMRGVKTCGLWWHVQLYWHVGPPINKHPPGQRRVHVVWAFNCHYMPLEAASHIVQDVSVLDSLFCFLGNIQIYVVHLRVRWVSVDIWVTFPSTINLSADNVAFFPAFPASFSCGNSLSVPGYLSDFTVDACFGESFIIYILYINDSTKTRMNSDVFMFATGNNSSKLENRILQANSKSACQFLV